MGSIFLRTRIKSIMSKSTSVQNQPNILFLFSLFINFLYINFAIYLFFTSTVTYNSYPWSVSGSKVEFWSSGIWTQVDFERVQEKTTLSVQFKNNCKTVLSLKF